MLYEVITMDLISFWSAFVESDTDATFFKTDAGVGSLFFILEEPGSFCLDTFFLIEPVAMYFWLKYYDKKVGSKIKNVKSYLLTTFGSWSNSWKVFSARPFAVSINPLGQYSHWII